MTAPDVIVRPEHFLRYLRETVGVRPSELKLPRWGVIVFGGDDWRSLRRALRAKRVPWYRSLCVGRAGRIPAVIARSPIGAPAAAITMEEMAALGVHRFLAFGACGSLRKNLRIGDVVVPAFAVPDDGTSRQYGGPKRPRPDAALRDALIAACERRGIRCTPGGTWTVDAVYRESSSRARALARQGVIAVEMEASALWAIARLRKVKAASLFVVSDELGGDDWNAGFSDPCFLAAKRKALRVVTDVISGSSG
jgi:uridine phosphorylase